MNIDIEPIKFDLQSICVSAKSYLILFANIEYDKHLNKWIATRVYLPKQSVTKYSSDIIDDSLVHHFNGIIFYQYTFGVFKSATNEVAIKKFMDMRGIGNIFVITFNQAGDVAASVRYDNSVLTNKINNQVYIKSEVKSCQHMLNQGMRNLSQ
jgi:hypothetical protein